MHRQPIRILLVSCLLSVPASLTPTVALSAPSFDCAKASTPAEELICNTDLDETLAARDNELATIYRRVLIGAGNRRANIVAAQSQWIRQRDTACIVTEKSDHQRAQCLAERYDERIRVLKPMQAGAKESLALCNGLVDDYKTALQTVPRDHKAVRFLETLKKAPNVRLEIAESTEFASATRAENPTAEDYIKQNFRLDAALLQTLREDTEDGSLGSSLAVWMTRLPKTDVYGISTLNGSMRCEAIELLFNAEKDEATEVDIPGNQSECTGSYFTTIGDQPALISDDFIGETSPKNYHLVEGYSIHPWKSDWLPACNISLTYAPEMNVYPANPAPVGAADDTEDCPVGDKACADLRQAVLTLMRRYKDDPETMPRRLISELSDSQRQQFLMLKAASDAQASGSQENPWETGNYKSLALDVSGMDAIPLNRQPVALPLVLDGKLLLILAGHQMTTGSRDLSDYDVWVKEMKGDKATFVTSLAISLSFGALREVKVSLR